MRKLEVGSLAIVSGGLLLSLELYALKLLQWLDKVVKNEWRTDAISYVNDTNVKFALAITIAVIVYGFVLVVLSLRSKNNKNSSI